MAEDFNNLAYWFPKLQATGAPVPRTEIINTDAQLIMLCDEKKPEGYDKLIGEICAAADRVGYPFFLRTGHGSGKHDFERTCFVPERSEVHRHVSSLVNWSECVDMLGLPTQTWVVREFLQLDSSFTAFSGLPINRERRYFFRGGKVCCHHPYWPESAVEDGDPTDPDWRSKLAAMNHEPADEVELLTRQTEQVAAHFDGAWSLDWAMDRAGKFWAIDMAQMYRSFHWPGCPIMTEEVAQRA